MSKLFVSVLFVLVLGIECSAKTEISDTISPAISILHYGEAEGLNSKTVFAVLQDKEGFMWFGTDAGVFRYDGKNFQRFTINDGVSDNEVLGLFEDHLDRIWFLTLNGHLSFWKHGKIYNPRNTGFLNEAYNGSSITSCFEDKENRLWFGSILNGLIIISNDSVRAIGFFNDEKRIGIEYVHEDQEGGTWCFRGDKMYKLLGDNFSDSIILPAPVTRRHACHANNNSALIYYSTEGIFKISDRAISLCIDKTQLPETKDIVNIVADNNHVWLCTTGGCYEYKNGKLATSYFEKYIITSVLKDREGNLWFGTMNQGIFMTPASHNTITNFNSSTGLSGDIIYSMARGTNGSLWLGYSHGMVDEITGYQKKTYILPSLDKRVLLRVTSLLVDSDITWCGTDLGIYWIRNGKVGYIPFDRKIKNVFYAVKNCIGGNTNTILGTYSFGFFEIRKDAKGYFLHQEVKSPSRTFSILKTKANAYLVSEINGLMEYIPGKDFIPYKTDIDLTSVRIIDMKVDPDSLLILASAGKGLYIFKDRKLVQQITVSSGLSDDNCNKIFILSNRIFLATHNGLNILEKKEGKYIFQRTITAKNGLPSNSVNDVISDSATIYAATDNGLAKISHTLDPYRGFAGRVMITEIITDSAQSVLSDHYNFKNDIPRLLVRFAYPVYNPANKLKIKYRMLQGEKRNASWIYASGNEVEFSSFDPGNYILQLAPDINASGDSNITSLYIKIKPLWWQTIAVRIALCILFLVMVMEAVRKITERRYERKIAELKHLTMLEAERNRIASDIHDDLGADLTHISILGEIAQRNKLLEADTIIHLNKMTNASKEAIDKMSQIVWALNSSNDSLANLIAYLHNYSKEFLESKNIECTVVFPKNIPDKKLTAAYRRNVFLIVKEAINNLSKHSGTAKADITITIEEPGFQITIEDYGNIAAKDKFVKKGNGLNNMKKRAAANKAELEIISGDSGGTIVYYRAII